MPGVAVTVVQVSPRPTAVIVQTTTWAEFPRLWRPMLDEIYGHPDDRGAFTTQVFHLIAP